MILPRQKLYAITPLSLAQEATRGGKSLQSVVEAHKQQALENWQKANPGKKLGWWRTRKLTKPINEVQRSLQDSINHGIHLGIPEQYAERSVLSDMVGQTGIARSDNTTRAARRYLSERRKLIESIPKEQRSMEFYGGRDEPTISIEQFFQNKYNSQSAAAERLKRIMKSREPYLPDKVIKERINEAMWKKNEAAISAERNMKEIRAHVPYSDQAFAEKQTARLILGDTNPPTPSLVYGPKWLTGMNERWRSTW